ncbi:MAG: hypothetical protein D6E12_04175 [Desulfovibrio sp.]|nr:MAG: hypothetical protein D6E12_04175 [Desulfovibrio sp.]
MAKKPQSPKQQTAVKLFLCVLVLLAVAGLLLVPKFMRHSELKKDIITAKATLLERQKYSDAYITLLAMESKLMQKCENLEAPESNLISTLEFESATEGLIEAIKRHDLSPPEEGFEMVTTSLTDYGGQVLVTAEFTGDFTDAWGFFVELGTIPHVLHIQSIDMEDRFEAVACRLALRLSVTRGD